MLAYINHPSGEDPPILEREAQPRRQLKSGIYVPTLAFFNLHTEDLDIETISNHVVRMAKSGVAGIVTQGTNGEAAHLSHTERKVVTKATRDALDAAGYRDMPLIVGCGAQSTREAIELCYEARISGADFAIILPSSYYKGFYNTDSIKQLFIDVAAASPIPLLIYNYPAAASGTDLDSDTIIELAKHPNIVGCKLTCGNTGKLNRIAAATGPPSHDLDSSFACMGGSADFIVQALIGGGCGAVCGLANIAPKACVRIFNLYNSGQVDEATKLQATVAVGDWVAMQSGVAGSKSVLEHYFGYGGLARKPLPQLTTQEAITISEKLIDLVSLENAL